MRTMVRAWGLVGVVAALACGPDEPAGASCPREEGGVATQTPCPTNYTCILLTSGLQRACVPRCRFNSECALTQCCKPITEADGSPATYGGCIAPSNGDRSVCTGPAAPASSVAGQYVGQYVGTYTVTRTSDLPPREGDVSEVGGYTVTVARTSETGLTVTIDPGCPLAASGEVAQVSVFRGNTCTSRTLLLGAALTVTSGSGTRSGNQITLRVDFQYVTADGSDRGTLSWGYTGARQ